MRVTIAIGFVISLVATSHADESKPEPPTNKPADKPVGDKPARDKPVDKPAVDKPGVDKPTDKPAVVNENPFDAYTGANADGRERFVEARAKLREGNQSDACAKFADAYKQEEATSTQLNLARCRE